MNIRFSLHFFIVPLFLIGSIFSCPVSATNIIHDSHTVEHADIGNHHDCCPSDTHQGDEISSKIVGFSFQKNETKGDTFFSSKKCIFSGKTISTLPNDFFIETKHIDKQHLFFTKTIRLLL